MPATTPAVQYAPRGAFHADLQRCVDAHFAARGRSRRGGRALAVKSLVLAAWLLASWALLLFAHPGPLAALLLAVSAGLAMAGVGFDVMHDANHGASSGRRWVNRLLGYSLDLIGGS